MGVTHVLLACKDLMTSSRLELAEGLQVQRVNGIEQLRSGIEQVLCDHGGVVVVVDLTAFAELPAIIRSWQAHGQMVDDETISIVAFAPHVQVQLLDEARMSADLVVPRGAVMKDLGLQVRRAMQARRDAAPGHG